MKILAIGHSIIDHIENINDGQPLPGGIYYSIIGLLSQKNNNDKVFLLTSINDDGCHLFEKVYSKVDLTYSVAKSELPEVFLSHNKMNERIEVYKNLSSQLSLDKINDWNFFDGILINMITGFDISLSQLKEIRKNFLGTIYFDLHTLSRGVDEKLKRDYRALHDADEWLKAIDILQCNEQELRTISFTENNDRNIEAILNRGLKYLIITKGEKGAELFFKEDEKIMLFSVKGKRVNIKNRIGSGDIFGAVFFYNYLCHEKVENCLTRANDFAAKAVSTQINFILNNFLYDQ